VLIALGLLWIPKIGIIGAGISVLASEVTQSILLFWQWRAK
jgi:O-antigen/teichoic acid export membrane protein